MNARRKIIIIIIVAVVLLLIVIAFFAFYMDRRANIFVSNIIYFLTLLAIIYYSYETKLLREATLGRPLISIIKNVSDTIEIRNDGSSIAYNIKIYFYYSTRKSQDKIDIAILGKGLSYKVGISSKKIKKINGEEVKLSDLINALHPDKKLKVLIEYSDSLEDKNQFKDKWKLDETVIMSNAGEGRFRMKYDIKK